MTFWRKLANVALTALAASLASLGTLAVTAAGFTLSFDAIRAVAVAAHVRESWAWMMPVAVDGSMAVATVVAIVLYKITGKHRAYPWVVLAVGIVVSMASNGLHATGPAGGVLELDWRLRVAVATVPAVMLALSFHLLATLVSIVSETVSKGQAEDKPRTEGRVTVDLDKVVGVDIDPAGTVQAVQLSSGEDRTEDTADLSNVQAEVDRALDTAGQELGQEVESYLSRLAQDIGQDKASVQPVTVDRPRGQASRGLSTVEVGEVRDLMSWGRAAGQVSVGVLRTWVAEQYGVSAKTVQRAEL